MAPITIAAPEGLLASGGVLELPLPSSAWLNTRQVQTELQMSNNQIHSLIATGRLKAIKVVDALGNTVALYVQRDSMEAYAKVRRPRSAA